MFISKLTSSDLTDDIIDKILFEGIKDTKENTDCAIVLGSTKASQYKIPLAATAYHEKRVPKLLLSGGKVKDFDGDYMSEAEHMYKTAITLGVKLEDIILETRSQNTVENILSSMFELQRAFCINRIKRVLLVTTTYHMRRSLSIAQYMFPKHIEVLPCPADDTNTRRNNWTSNSEGRKRATEECKKIIACVTNGLFPDFMV